MTSRPSLWRSAPFLVLLIASVASLALGAWIALSKVMTMVTGLTANSATAGDVYGGQSWIVLGSALAGAGLIGLFLALTLAALRSILPGAAEVEEIDEVVVADEAETADVLGTADDAEPNTAS